MSNSVQPHRWQPTRLPYPWDSPGKNTGVGCHFLLQCMKVKSESEVAQLCPTLSDLIDCSLPGSSVHEIFQAVVLEWIAISFSRRGSSQPRDWTHICIAGVSFIAGRFFAAEPPVLVTQSYPTLFDPMDCSPPGFSVYEILQARILEWVVMPFSRGSSRLSG